MADLRAVEARLQSAGFTVAEPEALDYFVKLANELGITPTMVADDYEIMNSLKENCTMDVCLSHVSSKAFKDFVAKQHNSAPAKAAPARVTGTKQPFGNSWENVLDRDVPSYQPTPKRQAVGTTPGNAKPGSVPGLPARTPLPKTPHTRITPVNTDLDHATTVTPMPTPSMSATKFASRAAKGDLVLALNDHLPEWNATALQGGVPVEIQLLGEALPAVGQHLYMTETMETKIQSVEERLLDWSEHLSLAEPEAKDAKTQPINHITPEPIWCVGRVVLETSAEEGCASRLTAGSLYLEGSRTSSDGARVRLDVGALQMPGATGARFFPGQVLGVKGINPTGNTLVAHSICTSLPAPLAPAPAPDTTARCVVVAAGPFTTADEVCFSPLEGLLQHCTDRQPDAILLLGPFMDTSHTLIQEGMLENTLDTVFQDQVIQRVSAWQASHSPHTRIVLLPSTRDAHHAPVHPTPAFTIPAQPTTATISTTTSNRQPGSTGGLSSFQSPCVLDVGGGLTIGVTSADVLKALSACDLALGAQGQDRLGALATHIIGQKSFFPVMPSPLGTCLDLSHATALNLPVTPHVLVLPSDLAPFAKLLPATPSTGPHDPNQQVVGINPGRLVRGSGAGTFTVVCLQPGPGSTSSRCRVEVRKV